MTTLGTCILVYVPNIPPFYHPLLAVPSVTLPSIMACRVFRDTRLRFFKDTHPTSFIGITPISTEVGFAPRCEVPLTDFELEDSRGFQRNTTTATISGEDLQQDVPAKPALPGEAFRACIP